jgi:GT2 family glycosyltransferase
MAETSHSLSLNTPRVGIILLNYGKVEETLTCLGALKALNYPDFKVIVVDNASPDDSVDILTSVKNKPDCLPFELLISPSNGGYSAGNNLGMQWALNEGCQMIWLLNNDTQPDPDALTPLVQESIKTEGLVGSVCRYPDGTFQRVGTRLKWLTGSVKGYPEHALKDGMAVDNLTGASMLIPRAVIEQIGLLPEPYFLYFEDGEYCLRAQKAGFKTTVSVQSIVYHKEGATTGSQNALVEYCYHRNRLRMFWDYGWPLQRVCLLAYTVFRFVRSIIKAMLSFRIERWQSIKIQWLALGDFIQGKMGKGSFTS